ncbi:MAG: zinc-binding dehydrogenase [Chloroflexota bacterium]
MKALVFKAPHQPIALEDLPVPNPKEGEVLVKLQAASMNHRDNWMTMGLYPKLTPDVIPGSCGTGVVEGEAVLINPNLNWGDDPRYPNQKTYDILGMPHNGTFAEYIAVNRDRLVKRPDHLTVAEGAALPLAGLTAYRALMTKGEANVTKKILVNGIGGGVALFAFQFAVALGAEVFVTSSSAEKIEKAIELGATGGALYSDPKWGRDFSKEHGKVDLVIDSAGGDGFASLLKVCNPLAKIVVYGGTRGLSKLNPPDLFFKEIEIIGSTMGSDIEFKEMVEFVETHQIRPIVDSVFSFEAHEAAYTRMREGKQFGKIVFKIAQES